MKYLHVSKTITAVTGRTFRNSGNGDRKMRRLRLISARQQRIERKAWRAEAKCESRINAEIAARESMLDWQEDEAENNAFERERRADELYEEHLS